MRHASVDHAHAGPLSVAIYVTSVVRHSVVDFLRKNVHLIAFRALGFVRFQTRITFRAKVHSIARKMVKLHNSAII